MSKPLLSVPFVSSRDATASQPQISSTNATRIVAEGAKRIFDIMAASTLLLLLVPVFLAVAVLVVIDGGPVFFRHRRIGRNGESFGCLKFRTMILGAQDCLDEYLSHHPEAKAEWAREQKLSFDPRVTSVGRFLRKASIDELPQLVNVIKGEMSLVGPRPVTQGELVNYGITAPLYKSVRPGITGLWQVSGRNDVSYDMRVRLDEKYVRNWGFFADMMILLRTPAVVFSRRGAR